MIMKHRHFNHRSRRHRVTALASVVAGVVIGLAASVAWTSAHQAPRVSYAQLLLQDHPAYAGNPFSGDTAFWQVVKDERVACLPADAPKEYDTRCIVGRANTLRRIWLFGSSTLHNVESPDVWTIASQVQMRLPDWRVELRTISSATLLTDVEMMKAQTVRHGDIVVLYGIWNDSLAMYYGDEHRPAAYKLALDAAREWCAARGARLVVIVQPLIWSKPLTDIEQTILDRVYPVWYMPPVNGPDLMMDQQELMRLSPDALDLTHVLDKLRDNGPVYFDGWHTNWRANAVIAEAIADWIVGF